MFEPLIDIGNQTVFGVINPNARGNVHRGYEHHSLLNAGFTDSVFHLVSDIQIFTMLCRLKCEIFRIEAHSEDNIFSGLEGNPTGHILVVDDEPALLKMMGLYLGRVGYSVVMAETTAQAWAAADGAHPEFSAAVLDASMEGMSTQDLGLKLLAANPALRVIVTSGYPVDMTAIEAAAPGRVMFLPKPFTPEMLASAVRRMLAAEEAF